MFLKNIKIKKTPVTAGRPARLAGLRSRQAETAHRHVRMAGRHGSSLHGWRAHAARRPALLRASTAGRRRGCRRPRTGALAGQAACCGRRDGDAVMGRKSQISSLAVLLSLLFYF